MNSQLSFLTQLDKSLSQDEKNMKLLLYRIRDFKHFMSKLNATLSNFSQSSRQYAPLIDASRASERAVTYLFAVLGCYSYKAKYLQGKSLSQIRSYFEGSNNPIMDNPLPAQELKTLFINVDTHTKGTLNLIISTYWKDSITPSVLNTIDKYEEELIEIYNSLNDYDTTNEKN